MVQYSHNSPYYELHFSELEDDAVRVLAFEGIENISRLFKYSFQLLSENAELNAEDILNKKATFIMNRGDEDPLTITGIISRFEQRGQSPDYVSYYAELVPKMWRLGLTFQSRIFQNMDIEKMVTEVLETSEFSGDDFEFQLNETYPELEFAVQYRESDFDFVNRRLEHFGIYYYFEHREENDVIVFTDSNDNLSQIDTGEHVLYNPNKDPLSEIETVSQFIYQGQVVTGKTQLKDYNYREPSKDLLSESQISEDSPGTYSNYGDHYKDETEGQFLARVRNEEIICNSVNYKGKSDCRLLRAGYKFTMGEHFREDWNLEYLLTRVLTRGNQRGLFGILQPQGKVEPTYENYFEALPPDIIFRPNRLTQHPKIHGILNAKVDAAGDGEQAEIDDQGRYKVILPFDLSGSADGEASHYIRMIQPYAGPNYGTHFPLHKDTEVLLTFIDGNPDRPIISGAVPNPETISPVTNQNQTKSVIRDNYGNEIVMDATPGDEHIRLHSPHHHSLVEIGRSIKSYCDDDLFDGFFGNKYEYGVGTKFETYGGVVAEAIAGLKGSLMIGGNYEIDIGGKYTYGLAYNINNTVGPDIKSSEVDMLSTAKQDSVIVSGDQLCMVAAAKKDNAVKPIIYAGENKLSFSIGKQNESAEYFKNSSGWMGPTSMFTSILVGAMASVALHFAANKSGENIIKDWKFWTPVAVGGTSFIGTLILSFLTVIRQLRDSKIEPIEHVAENQTTATAKITLIDKENEAGGIYLETTEKVGQSLLPSADIQVLNNGTINIGSKKNAVQIGTSFDGNEFSIGPGSLILLDQDDGIFIGTENKAIIEMAKTGKITIQCNENFEIESKGDIKFSPGPDKKVIDDCDHKVKGAITNRNFSAQ